MEEASKIDESGRRISSRIAKRSVEKTAPKSESKLSLSASRSTSKATSKPGRKAKKGRGRPPKVNKIKQKIEKKA